MYKIWFARNYRTYVANTVLRDNALATMGAELPSAMMAAMLYPDRRVMAVCGDSGFMMNSQELETAVRLKLNLVVLILNDGAFGMIRWKQAADSFADFGLTFGAQTDTSHSARLITLQAAGSTAEALTQLIAERQSPSQCPRINYARQIRTSQCPADLILEKEGSKLVPAFANS